MQTITTVGLDIAKSVFQVHCVDGAGHVVIRRQLKRRYVLAFFQKLPPCLIRIEACASSHYWSRELQARGHGTRLTIWDARLVVRYPGQSGRQMLAPSLSACDPTRTFGVAHAVPRAGC